MSRNACFAQLDVVKSADRTHAGHRLSPVFGNRMHLTDGKPVSGPQYPCGDRPIILDVCGCRSGKYAGSRADSQDACPRSSQSFERIRQKPVVWPLFTPLENPLTAPASCVISAWYAIRLRIQPPVLGRQFGCIVDIFVIAGPLLRSFLREIEYPCNVKSMPLGHLPASRPPPKGGIGVAQSAVIGSSHQGQRTALAMRRIVD